MDLNEKRLALMAALLPDIYAGGLYSERDADRDIRSALYLADKVIMAMNRYPGEKPEAIEPFPGLRRYVTSGGERDPE